MPPAFSDLVFPRIMGVVNVTPDSFSDGGRFFTPDRAVQHAMELVAQGADMVDIGGESSRPGAESVQEHEEIRRVVPVIAAIRAAHPTIPISIDTVKYGVAKAALEAGATMLNDISGLQQEPRLAELAGEFRVPLVLMHCKGTPRTMQQNPHYDDVVQEVHTFLAKQIAFARSCGVQEVYADVGIGFGKTVEHNVTLLKHHHEFATLGVPLLLGVSRKSLFGKLLGIAEPQERDYATLATHLFLLQAQASVTNIIRVHNVAIFAQARTLLHALQSAL